MLKKFFYLFTFILFNNSFSEELKSEETLNNNEIFSLKDNKASTARDIFIDGMLQINGDLFTNNFYSNDYQFCIDENGVLTNGTFIVNGSVQINSESNDTIIAGGCDSIFLNAQNISLNNVAINDMNNLGNTYLGNDFKEIFLIGSDIYLSTPAFSNTSGLIFLNSDSSLGLITSTLAHKENITKLNEISDELVKSLNPVKFKYKNGYGDNGQNIKYGLLIEELIDTDLKELINNNSIDYISLITLIIKKLADLIDRIKVLEESNVEVKNENINLKKEIIKLKKILEKKFSKK